MIAQSQNPFRPLTRLELQAVEACRFPHDRAPAVFTTFAKLCMVESDGVQALRSNQYWTSASNEGARNRVLCATYTIFKMRESGEDTTELEGALTLFKAFAATNYPADRYNSASKKYERRVRCAKGQDEFLALTTDSLWGVTTLERMFVGSAEVNHVHDRLLFATLYYYRLVSDPGPNHHQVEGIKMLINRITRCLTWYNYPIAREVNGDASPEGQDLS